MYVTYVRDIGLSSGTDSRQRPSPGYCPTRPQLDPERSHQSLPMRKEHRLEGGYFPTIF